MRESERERRFEDLNTFPGRLRVEFNLLEVSIVRNSIPNQFRGTFLPRERERERERQTRFEDLNTLPCRVRVVFNLVEVAMVRDSIQNKFRGTFLQ